MTASHRPTASWTRPSEPSSDCAVDCASKPRTHLPIPPALQCRLPMRLYALTMCGLLSLAAALAQDPIAGRLEYDARCATCHGGDANGGEHGPGIISRIAMRDDA